MRLQGLHRRWVKPQDQTHMTVDDDKSVHGLTTSELRSDTEALDTCAPPKLKLLVDAAAAGAADVGAVRALAKLKPAALSPDADTAAGAGAAAAPNRFGWVAAAAGADAAAADAAGAPNSDGAGVDAAGAAGAARHVMSHSEARLCTHSEATALHSTQ